MTLPKAWPSGTGSFTKAAISSGVGGRPVRSNVARRSSVRRSAKGAGLMLAAVILALRNASTGLRAGEGELPTGDAAAGTAGFLSGWYAHKSSGLYFRFVQSA